VREDRARPKRSAASAPVRKPVELKPDELARVAGGYEDEPHGYE